MSEGTDAKLKEGTLYERSMCSDTISASPMIDCLEEWKDLGKEYAELEESHRNYCKKVEEVKALQKKCMSGIAHQRYRLKYMSENIKKVAKEVEKEDQGKLDDFEKEINVRKTQFRELEDVLPHENGIYLKIILGSVNVSLLSKHDKYLYKENYEHFKYYVTIISFVFAVLLWFLPQFRVTDAAFQFLLVWYYCTLTIREHILKVNGSRIRGWWITHHFISTVCAGILLIWPDGYTYNQFRNQFVVFTMYISIVQILQYYYQKGCLYRLRALGERRTMDVTVEGFQSWMWRGLSFILPFLIVGYCFQLYNTYILFWLSRSEKCIEWQVLVLAIIFLILFTGNTISTVLMIRQKIVRDGWMTNLEFVLQNKYRFSSNFSKLANKVHNY